MLREKYLFQQAHRREGAKTLRDDLDGTAVLYIPMPGVCVEQNPEAAKTLACSSEEATRGDDHQCNTVIIPGL